jgi:hypothetical protein
MRMLGLLMLGLMGLVRMLGLLRMLGLMGMLVMAKCGLWA